MRKELREFQSLCIKNAIKPADGKDMFRLFDIRKGKFEDNKIVNAKIYLHMVMDKDAVEKFIKSVD